MDKTSHLNKCSNCLIPFDETCNGQTNRRLCELTDSTSEIYNASYIKLLAAPSVMDKIKGVVSAAVNYVAQGLPNLPDEEFEKRMDICRSCSSYDGEANKCTLCGCFLEIKARAGSSECPLGLWPVYKTSKVEDCGCNK